MSDTETLCDEKIPRVDYVSTGGKAPRKGKKSMETLLMEGPVNGARPETQAKTTLERKESPMSRNSKRTDLAAKAPGHSTSERHTSCMDSQDFCILPAGYASCLEERAGMFEKMEEKMRVMEEKMKGMKEKMKGMEEKMKGLQDENTSLKRSVDETLHDMRKRTCRSARDEAIEGANRYLRSALGNTCQALSTLEALNIPVENSQ